MASQTYLYPWHPELLLGVRCVVMPAICQFPDTRRQSALGNPGRRGGDGSGVIAAIAGFLMGWDLERMCFLEMRLHQRSLFLCSFWLGLSCNLSLLSTHLHCVTWLKSPLVHSLVQKKYLLSTCCMLRIAFSDVFCLES